jgi:hypothetical protein
MRQGKNQLEKLMKKDAGKKEDQASKKERDAHKKEDFEKQKWSLRENPEVNSLC